MNNQFETYIKEQFVSAIKSGLNETQTVYGNTNKRINNAKHFVKMDNIANCVIKSFEEEDRLKIITFQRGSYTVVLVYDTENYILYSLMSSKRFQELLDRKDHSHVHYLDALVNFNDKLDVERYQQVIDESIFEQNINEIDKIKEKVINQINGIEPEKYITVSFSMDNFRLISVEAILTSEYLEVIDREDWSEFIEIDYSDISYEQSNTNADFDDLDISLKPNISRNDDISEEHITSKTDKKDNQA